MAPAEPLPTFPVHLLPAPAAELALAGAEAIGVPVDMVALPILVAMAAAIGGSRVVHIDTTWRERAVLWGAVVAPPASGKSPAVNLALRPLNERDDDYVRDFDHAMGAWEAAEAENARRKPGDRDAPPAKPTERSLVVDDFTIEQLCATLSANPRGVVAVKDELSGWVRALNQYKGGAGSDRSHALSLWSSGRIKVQRKSAPRPIVIPQPFVSLVGGIQPAVLPELREKDDGMLERFLFVLCLDAKAKGLSDKHVPRETLAGWDVVIGRLLGLEQARGAHGDEPRVMALTAAGLAAFRELSWAHADETNDPDLPDQMRSVYGKFPAYAGRLALVLQCAFGAVGHHVEHVDEPAVRSAWELVAYFKAHARAAHGEAMSGEADRRVDVLARWLARREGGSATTREIRNAGMPSMRTSGEALAVATRLEGRGLGSIQTRRVPGGKSHIVTLNTRPAA